MQLGLTYDVDYTRCAYVHDEVQLSVIPAEVDRVKQLLEAAAPEAGRYYNFRVPITAAADHGDNWASYTLIQYYLWKMKFDSIYQIDTCFKILTKAVRWLQEMVSPL